MGMLDKIQNDYLRKVPKFVHNLDELKNSILRTNSPEAYAEVRNIAHKMRGSAGTYGFSELSRTAAELEESPDVDLPIRLNSLISFLKSMPKPKEIPNILLVDDDPEIQHLFKYKLSEAECEVIVATDGKTARGIASSIELHLIFLDLTLPDVDGRQLLQELRANPKTSGVPVYIVSGVKAERVKSECLFLGASDCIEKPFDPERLLEIFRFQRNSSKMRPESKDILTGLANRGALREMFQDIRSKTNGKFVISLFQVEDLRPIAEKHGVSVTDGILRWIAANAGRHLPKRSNIGRFDADQFVALWTTSAEEASALTDKIVREAIERRYEAGNGISIQIQLSASIYAVTEGQSFDQAVQEAGVQLYQSKKPAGGTAPNAPVERPAAKVLVADDDELIVSFIRHRLSREGFDILSAPDGTGALDLAMNNDINLFILDVQMPGINGIELLSRLRKSPRHANTPVIMLTAMGNEHDIAQAFAKGANDYLVKPFSPVELQVRIRRFIR